MFMLIGFPGGSEVKVSAYNAGDLGSIPRSGRSPAEGNGNPLQYSCLENSMDGGACWGRKESDTTERLHFHFVLKETFPRRCMHLCHPLSQHLSPCMARF